MTAAISKNAFQQKMVAEGGRLSGIDAVLSEVMKTAARTIDSAFRARSPSLSLLWPGCSTDRLRQGTYRASYG
jgi:hypothetical protein